MKATPSQSDATVSLHTVPTVAAAAGGVRWAQVACAAVVDVLAAFPHCKPKMSWMSVGLTEGQI